MFIRLACKRHLDDLEAQNSEAFPYVFNPLMHNQAGEEYRPAERVCKFIELLPHVKGKWARERRKISLEDWQVFILASSFGWINRETALRRFRTIYIEVPRKNAKTTIAAGAGLYLEILDDEIGAEVVSAATSADQAKISWGIAKQMVDKSPGMQSRFGVQARAHSIDQVDTGSTFQYLSSDHQTLDGLNIHGGILDEVHAMKTRAVWDVIETATGAREQPLLFAITTAGTNRAGICYELRDYTTKILKGTTIDSTFFGVIYTIDKDDDWTDPATWRKANPNYGVSVFPDDLQRLADKARAMPTAQNNYKTKRLNIWVNADSAWLNMLAYDSCKDEAFPDLDGSDCYIGLDLASRIDIAAKVRLHPLEVDGKTHYFAKGKYYLPKKTVEESRNDSYEGWAEAGLLTVTPGDTIDYDFIETDILEDMERFNLIELPFDPYQATQLSTRMIAEGVPMVSVRPNVLNFSEPMKELESLILRGRFHHDGDPILAWMMSNVVAHLDKKDNIYPNKELPQNKIDGVICLIMALGRAINAEILGPSVYEERGIIQLN
ncbi:MAG: hypothetical protein KJN67_05705 [Pontiella sp.]|nr:hypothetical protein [Pontiella sp.]